MKEHQPRTLLDKIWDAHIVQQENEAPAILYIDLHLIHEVTSPQAFDELRKRKLIIHRPGKTFATIDHSVPTRTQDGTGNDRMVFADELARAQIKRLEENCAEHNITLFGLQDDRQGIVHVIGPELGLTQPGMTVVCGDSHTATHGAFGCLAFGIGTSEVGHVLATQCLLQNKPKACRVSLNGKRRIGVTAKDVILKVIQQMGVDYGVGYAFEYSGEAINNMNLDERMTICNMSIEAGARSGLIAPDEETFRYLMGKPFSPQGIEWEEAVEKWKRLHSDVGAVFDKEIKLDLSDLEPMITYGTNPSMSIPITGEIPSPTNDYGEGQTEQLESALQYMGFSPGERLLGKPIDTVFIGSCTNGRLSDFQDAANIFRNRRVAPNVQVLVVPGSQQVKQQAEELGLDQVFKQAGAEWREPGCSMCIAMNGDQLSPYHYAISTSNRNFEGRQGKNGRTLLASPITAAAAAVTGCITDPRTLL